MASNLVTKVLHLLSDISAISCNVLNKINDTPCSFFTNFLFLASYKLGTISFRCWYDIPQMSKATKSQFQVIYLIFGYACCVCLLSLLLFSCSLSIKCNIWIGQSIFLHNVALNIFHNFQNIN